MSFEEGYRKIALGCDLVDEALAQTKDEWDQHINLIHHQIIEICNREVRNSDAPRHLATPSSKRRNRRYTSAQKAIQSLLLRAQCPSLHSKSSLEASKRITRAQAKKVVNDGSLSSNYSKNESTSSSVSATETKGKRRGRPGRAGKNDEDVFVKPLEPVNRDLKVPKKEREEDEVDFAKIDGQSIEPTPQQINSDNDKKYGVNSPSTGDSMMSEDLSIHPPKPVASKAKESCKNKLKNQSEDTESEEEALGPVKRTEVISEENKENVKKTIISNTIAVSKNKNNAKATPTPPDSEWMTDDESYESAESIGDETYSRMTRKKSLNSSKKLSTVKKKRKQTEYFTPSIPRKSLRLTRATAKLDATPTQYITRAILTKNNVIASTSKSSRKLALSSDCHKNGTTTSGSSIASSGTTVSSVIRSESSKGKTFVPRTCTTPDNKTLTASAAKRRLAEEEKRQQQLAQLREKEEKAEQQRKENIKMKALNTKLKNEERRKKIEALKKKEEEELREKRLRDLSKQEEIERRRKEKEEAKKREAQKHKEKSKTKEQEHALRKQQEEEERRARLQRQEELNRKKQEENERVRVQQEKILQMIAQHNSNLQKNQHVPLSHVPVPKVHNPQQSLNLFKLPSVPATSEASTPTPAPIPTAAATASVISQATPTPIPSLNKTFSMDEEKVKSKQVSSYQMTPPPKPKNSPANYDISDIKSDDDTDEEDKPKKQIPSWAKGEAFVAALDQQFAKLRKHREREIRSIFPAFDVSIDLEDIFDSKAVHQRYEKRTSSAVWSSPPCNSTINYSILSDCNT